MSLLAVVSSSCVGPGVGSRPRASLGHSLQPGHHLQHQQVLLHHASQRGPGHNAGLLQVSPPVQDLPMMYPLCIIAVSVMYP